MEIRKSIELKNHCTFKIGGPARFFAAVEDRQSLKEALSWARAEEVPVFMLGGGSNVLFSDQGFDGLVIKIVGGRCGFLAEEEGLETETRKALGDAIGKEGTLVFAQAGASLASLVGFSFKNDLAGLDWAAGIPGTVGGAVRGNAGAFGGETGQNVLAVQAINIQTGERKIFKKEEIKFGYRNSFFKADDRWIIWAAIFGLPSGDGAALRKRALEIVRSRHAKQPELFRFPSAGSVFKNPVASEKVIREFEKDKGVVCKDDKVPAGWVIERCGLKGKKIGGAMISNKQANFIINQGGATAEEVVMLIGLVKTRARDQFGLKMEEEVQIVAREGRSKGWKK